MADYFQVELSSGVAAAIALGHASETLALERGQIYPIPGTNPHLMGITDWRGRLLWVLDLGSLLGLPKLSRRSSERLTLLAVANPKPVKQQLACAVETIAAIVSLESLGPVPGELKPRVRSLLTGMGAIGPRPVAVLDVPAIFAALQSPGMAANRRPVTAVEG